MESSASMFIAKVVRCNSLMKAVRVSVQNMEFDNILNAVSSKNFVSRHIDIYNHVYSVWSLVIHYKSFLLVVTKVSSFGGHPNRYVQQRWQWMAHPLPHIISPGLCSLPMQPQRLLFLVVLGCISSYHLNTDVQSMVACSISLWQSCDVMRRDQSVSQNP